ncbi:hypothetical protein [Weissella sagaensis]|nr:hypothetical protein [Weissella sagaensis]
MVYFEYQIHSADLRHENYLIGGPDLDRAILLWASPQVGTN